MTKQPVDPQRKKEIIEKILAASDKEHHHFYRVPKGKVMLQCECGRYMVR